MGRRDDEIRARLTPLEPGERPTAVTVAALVAALIAIANVVLYLTGYEVRGRQPAVGGVVAVSFVMGLAAIGMWRSRYWAALGFQALLAVTTVFAGLSLLVASNVEAVVRSTVMMLGAGTLFWFLVRAMARLQMPQRPTRE